ncbi:P-loop containing nucleoside triphosphate hydrolase protein [Cylindrobasidium torrendii FP15055 ss-10]|uniref:RNA helicase n=1 Tax=Cylindrobasidium torrendii FP15055 ss-10 TaxID=1314674 RepID=A0A0D7BF80_9AGAR|nr:P-loop containing nucleoside triphosphate hydrolase protein [Cylindrobasidium torrendii FP15055 ss-10]
MAEEPINLANMTDYLEQDDPLSGFVQGSVTGAQIRSAMFKKGQVIIVVGETGSGKTTQIPQFVAYSDLPHTRGKMVACTQPGRVSAMSVAKRVADEMDVQLGHQVGYSTRFENMFEPRTTFLKYMSDSVLLREAMDDPTFSRYSTIILDDAHERTLATDILMGLLKKVARTRPDLKIIIMCGTSIDSLKFQRYFSIGEGSAPAPLFKISGRPHPIEVLYTQRPEDDYVEAAIRTVLMIHQAEGPGDILLFLTDKEEIEDACLRIKLEADDLVNQDPDSVGPLTCIPLYSSLPLARRERIFDQAPMPTMPNGPHSRKVVVLDDTAVTSLAIDSIVYVVDPGFSKQKVYNPRTRVESLLASPISKNWAQERASRVGRTQPGKCFRLYTEKDFVTQLDEQTYPEILRCNLSNTVLQLVKMGITDLIRFDYVDAPAPETLMRALELLSYLSALDDDGNITALGTMMADFPLDPPLSKALIISPKFNCSSEILAIASMLSAPSVWVRPPNTKAKADAAKALFTFPEGDHLTRLNVFNHYLINKGNKPWADDNSLDMHALTQAENAHTQLKQIMQRWNVPLLSFTDKGKLFQNIRKVLVCGFFTQIAYKAEGYGKYVTVKDNQIVQLHPSSGLSSEAEWVLYDECILTDRAYIKGVTQIMPEWLLEFAPDYFDLRYFPGGEMKQALQRVQNRRLGQAEDAGTSARLRVNAGEARRIR